MVFRRRRDSRRDAVKVTEPATLASVSTATAGVLTLLDAGEVPDRNYRLVVDSVRSKGSQARTLAVGAAAKRADHSIVAAHLAVSAVASGLRVVLVDGALQDSRLAPLFERPDPPGLTDVLSHRVALGDALKPPLERRDLLLLPAGTPATQPDELLRDPALVALMSHLAQAADMIVVDTAPANLQGWANLLDGALLVAPERATARTTELTDTHVFGVIRTHDRDPEAGDVALSHLEEIAAEILPTEPVQAEAGAGPADAAAEAPEPADEDEEEAGPPLHALAPVDPGRAFDGPVAPTTVRTVGEIMADLAARRREQDLSATAGAGASNWRSRPRGRRHRTGAPTVVSPARAHNDQPAEPESAEPESAEPESTSEPFIWDPDAPVVAPGAPHPAASDRGDDEPEARDDEAERADTDDEPAVEPTGRSDDPGHDVVDDDIDAETASEILFLPSDEGA